MGPTNPSEEHFKGGLWGWATSTWVKLVATAGGLLKVQFGGQDVDVEVKQQAAADLVAGVHGWHGAAWYKQPMIWAYSDTYRESDDNLNVGAGDRDITFTAVSSGEVWVLTNFIAYSAQSNVSRVEMGAWIDGTFIQLVRAPYPVAELAIRWQGHVPLSSTDLAYVVFRGCVAGDDLYAQVSGYKMKFEA